MNRKDLYLASKAKGANMRAGNLHGQLMARGLQSVWKRHEACSRKTTMWSMFSDNCDSRKAVKRFPRPILGHY